MAQPTIETQLLDWYDQNRRVLPWRESPTPYAVLLSELMLQQTRVDTVIPYFHRFLTRWPRLEDLAEATEESVVEEWAGLGYYSRARNLHKAAVKAVEQGGLPSSVAGLMALPGIGPYTAGAISSIAFGRVAPIVDGNVERVLCRLDGLRGDPRKGETKKRVWARATELVSKTRPGDFNQSLMELGALVCTPKSPRCGMCPIRTECVGHREGIEEELPEKAKKKKPKDVTVYSAVVCKDSAVLLVQRPQKGLLAGMWELPSTQGANPTTQDLADALLNYLSVEIEVGDMIGQTLHRFTHRVQRNFMYLVSGSWDSMKLESHYVGVRWLPIRELEATPLSKQARKTLDMVRSYLDKQS